MLEENTEKINILRTPTHLEWSCAIIVVLFGKIIR